MNCRILTPAAVLATLALAVTPAFAQHSSGGHSRSSGSSGSSRGSSGGSSGSSRGSSAGARSSAPSRTYSAPPSRTYSAGPSRTYSSAQSRGVYAQSRGSAVARGPVSRGFGSRGFGSRGGVFVAPFRFYRPFYSFRPRFSLGFGLWSGYPIAYPYSFYYGYPYAYPYDPYYDDPYDAPYPPPSYSYPIPNSSSAYPSANYPPANYPPANYPQTNGSGQSGYYESDRGGTSQPGTSLTAQPGAPSGSVSFEITPSTAEVLIDGKFAGHVSDLGPTTQPLGLTPGRHHIEIRAAGYQTMVVDADVVAGQVIPYQGQMQPGR
jgi:hypothetical protein